MVSIDVSSLNIPNSKLWSFIVISRKLRVLKVLIMCEFYAGIKAV